MNSLEIIDKKNEALQRMKDIVETCKKELREMTEDETKEFNTAKETISELKKELKNLRSKLENYESDMEDVKEERSFTMNEEEKTETRNNNLNETKTMEFRLLKAINDVANNRNLDENAQEFVKRGADQMRKSGLSFTGQIQIPNETRAAYTVTDTTKATVDTDTMSMLEAIRGKNILVNAGAKFLTGLVGDVQVPVLTGNQVSWEGEKDETADGGGSITSVKLQPKRLSCYIDISKQFLIQDSADAEMVLRQDLINAINAKLEQTIFGTGAGSATEPTGLFAASASPAVVDTYEKLANKEAEIDGTNILGAPCYILSNTAKAKFRCMPKVASTVGDGVAVAAGLVLENGEVDGTVAYNSSNVAAGYFAYGDFSNLAIAQWGAIDLVVDPYTKASQGMIRLVINAYFDIKPLRDKAIVVGKIA